MNVSAEQAKALLPILQNASTQLKALKAQRDASQPALVAALTQARDELRSTGAISESTRQAMKSARGGAAGAMRQDLQALHQQVNQILTPQQIQALKSVSLGVGHPSGNADMPARHGQRGFRKHFAIVKTLTSDAFLTLLQARAG